MKKLMLLALLLVGCEEANSSDHASTPGWGGVNYGKDNRTGLCFAFYDRGIANVPCSPEVEKLVPAPTPTQKDSCK